MESYSIIEWIVKKRKLIEKFFSILVLASILAVPFVGINYDLSKYLPQEAPSKQGLDLMEKEFGYPGTARVMIRDVSLYEAKLYKDKIEAINGVDMVMWMDTTQDVYQSNLFIRSEDIKDYYKDGYAVMDITFDEGDSAKLTHKAIKEIQKITGDKGYFSGSAILDKSLSDTLIKEVALAMVLAVIMIAFILCLTTTSWLEPFLFLSIMGIAIIINMGSNIFMGTISFLTFAVAAILQLAVAMDYSIFLLHSFMRERENCPDPELAMEKAIRSAVSSIMSSGATTIVGFLVLALMRFTIGRDMGIVLAKGIVISLATVLLLMPALILRWYERIEKFRHRSFMPSFEGFGKFIYKIRYVVLIGVILIMPPAYVAQGMNSFLYGNDALGGSEGTRVYDDEQEINKHFGRSNLILAIVPNISNVIEKNMADEIENLYYTKSVTSLASTVPDGIPENFLPKHVTKLMHTENYARILIYIRTANESDFAFKCSDEIKAIVNKYYPENAYIVGITPSTQDIKGTITSDYNVVNWLSLLGVAIVVMITFKSGIIPIVVMIPIEVAIFMNMSEPYLTGETMIFMGYIIVSCLQLGATIDYSILVTSNYLEARETLEKKEAAIAAVSRSALSVLTSGTILITVGYGLFFTSSVAAIAGIGRLVGRGAFFSMILVLGLLPVLMTASDHMIFSQKKRLEKLIRKRRQTRQALRNKFHEKQKREVSE